MLISPKAKMYSLTFNLSFPTNNKSFPTNNKYFYFIIPYNTIYNIFCAKEQYKCNSIKILKYKIR